MKPIHIMRWAPADYVNDPAVKLAVARRDFVSATFWPHFLFHAFIQGGELPAEPVALGAILGMRPADIRRAVAYWTEQGKLKERDGRLYHERVVRDIADELAFREEQAARGVLSGQARQARQARLNHRSTTVHAPVEPPLNERSTGRLNPPAPSPTPLPEPVASRPSPAPLNGHERPDELAEAKIRESKVADERKLLALVTKLEGCDPKGRSTAELMQLVTSYDKPDGRRVEGCVNPATLSYERVRKSLADAEALLNRWGGRG